MKNSSKITGLIAILVFCFTAVFAQKSVKEGSVVYEITEIEPETPEMMMMKGSRFSIYFNKSSQKTAMSMMGGMVEVNIHTDHDSKENVMLSNIMGQKFLVRKTTDDPDTEEKSKENSDFEIIFDKDDKKKILDYNCYKAILTDKEGNTFFMYVTDEIQPKVNYFENYLPGFNVFPLEYQVAQQGMKMIFSAKEFNTKVNADTFKYDATGYTEMSADEFQKQMGGMGGFGF